MKKKTGWTIILSRAILEITTTINKGLQIVFKEHSVVGILLYRFAASLSNIFCGRWLNNRPQELFTLMTGILKVNYYTPENHQGEKILPFKKSIKIIFIGDTKPLRTIDKLHRKNATYVKKPIKSSFIAWST